MNDVDGASSLKVDARDVLDRWRDAYKACDATGVAALYATDGVLAFGEEIESSWGREAIEEKLSHLLEDARRTGREVAFEWGEPIVEGEMVAAEFTDEPGTSEANGLAIMRIVRGQISFDRRFRERPDSGGE